MSGSFPALSSPPNQPPSHEGSSLISSLLHINPQFSTLASYYDSLFSALHAQQSLTNLVISVSNGIRSFNMITNVNWFLSVQYLMVAVRQAASLCPNDSYLRNLINTWSKCSFLFRFLIMISFLVFTHVLIEFFLFRSERFHFCGH